MKSILVRSLFASIALLFVPLVAVAACAAVLAAEESPTTDCQESKAVGDSPLTHLPPSWIEAAPASRLALDHVPDIPGMAVQREFAADGNVAAARYQNSAGRDIASFDPQDHYHNNKVNWEWESMSQGERDQALQWIFSSQQMTYHRFENQEQWVLNALRWIQKIEEISPPLEPEIIPHWQMDGPPLNQVTLYEALSRVKSLALSPERRTCSYGFSELGLIEYGGEIILFRSPAWQKVSVETREILTAVWTVKEAMVIYYPQSLGWSSACPSETERLKNEYYSTIWLLQAERALAKFVPNDRGYWQDQEIPLQLKKITTQNFPPCLPPASLSTSALDSK